MSIKSKQPRRTPPRQSLRGKPKVFVAMSGGVDSSVAAFLLKKEGYDVRGVYMKEWNPPGIECTSGDDRVMAARVAAHVNIPFTVWDFRKEYKKQVADYMLKEYRAGRTPNPDVMCNREIKFGMFLKRALREGADYIATGHYVKIKKYKNMYRLYQADDPNKDQTYFLWTLTQKELKHCLFPIGYYEKPKVREFAKKAKLPSWDKKDSQGVCFVGKLDFGSFLRTYLPHKKGKIITTENKEIGTHDGVWFYTLGQRHGIGIGGGTPYYVAAKNMKKNILTVGIGKGDTELFAKDLTVTHVNWISGTPPAFPFKCKARIRYRQPLQDCTIVQPPRLDNCTVVFPIAQRAITPGQSIVFYTKSQMLGGGVIS